MIKKKALVSFTLKLPREVNEALKREAAREYISKGQLIRELIKKEYTRIIKREEKENEN
uniref:Putative ribbon-helix-helix protein repressor n=1 Tax=viral metagenome TaxID=1070528 RepID=A0A6M3JNY2_9ZZZZ